MTSEKSSGFMGKKINLFLLIIIVLILLGFGGVSVYYQYTFKDVNQKYDNISSNLASCKQNLSQTADDLITAVRNLNSTTTDIRKYDVLYEEKAEELESKQTELSNTKAELTRVTLQKEVYKKQIDEAYSKIISLNNTIDDLNQEINSLNNEVEDQKDEISCLLNTEDDEEYDCI